MDAEILRGATPRDKEHVELVGRDLVERLVGLLRVALLALDLTLFRADDRQLGAGVSQCFGG